MTSCAKTSKEEGMASRMRRGMARCSPLKIGYACWKAVRGQFGAGIPGWQAAQALWWFWRQYQQFRRMSAAGAFILEARWVQPCLIDCTTGTPVEPVYFVQDTWFAGRIARQRPDRHVDVGSSARTMALVAQFIPVTMVDIRPVPLTVPGFSFVTGSILALPFPAASIESLSSLCVIEHIGLGRYGDPLDAAGSEKAIAELSRVLAPRGNLYLSVPVDVECRVYFNAHRAFTRDHLLGLCTGLVLEHEQFLYGLDVVPRYEASRGFGTGMFHLRKP
jgi:SAM-dependent methyltransferase